MPTSLLIARVQPSTPEQTGEFHRWYDEVHIPQVVERIPGIVSAARYRLGDDQLLPEQGLPAHGYVTIYQIDSPDIAATAQRLGEALGDGTLDMSEAISLSGATGPELLFYSPLSA